jgi:hypothetical protein
MNKLLKNIAFILALGLLSRCSNVFDLLIQNSTSAKIEIIYSPSLSSEQINHKIPEKLNYKKRASYKIYLDKQETIKIGQVLNKEVPDASFIDLDFLEIINGQDTITFKDKDSILTAFQQIDKYDWRILIK